MIPDPCCFACKSSTGICLTRFQCEHHKEADRRDEANHRARKTHRDPTGDRAAARADRARKKGRT